MLSLKDKVAIITGGNSGIGKATAQLFAKEGAQVIITGRRQDVVDQAVREIGHGAVGISGDVADLDHHKALAAEARQRFGGVDIYMANAAVINLAQSDMVTVEDYDR
jgi:NAD(P)-dependent dehydrogenase (short-subunit alcohol dehydrogenase family)